MFDLSGQRALVTGGGRGIGLAIVRAMAAHGASVVIAEKDEEAGTIAADTLCSAGLKVRSVELDVMDSNQVASAISEIWGTEGGFDILVNNAGMSARIATEDYPDEDLDRMIDLNIKGVFYCMRSAATHWLRHGHSGRIINLASFAGLVADPLSAPYAATKGAVVQLTRTCAVEWGSRGILVNAIAPGYVRTAMTSATLDAPVGKSLLAKTPLGRAADPSEIAGAAVFLASRAASYVTGHILAVDGGWTAA